MGLLLFLGGPSLAQRPFLQSPVSPALQPAVPELENLEVAPIYLDGYPIFSITAARLDTEDQTTRSRISPIRERAKNVRRQLRAIAQKNLDPANLRITSTAVDSSLEGESVPQILRVNGQYLMTVNRTDAELYGTSNIEEHAQYIVNEVKTALDRYYDQRQPAYVQRHLVQSLAIVVAMILMTLGLRIGQHRLRQHRQAVLDQLEQVALTQTEIAANLSPTEREEAIAQAQAQQAFEDRKNRIRFRYDIGSKLLQISLLCLWFGAIALILSFFPQTRWFQSYVLARILQKALAVVLSLFGTYLLIRLSFLATDYAFGLIQAGQQLSHHRPVRSLLRLQTLSGYVKSICVFGLTLGGILLMLTLFGLDLGPVLAGAGILGLAISFGSQNLIKDVLNGLFLIWEDQFGVGDVVTINQVSGAVETMNLRITQLRSQDGDLITLPNGSIEMVKNHSNQWSRANLGIEIAYHTDLDQAIEVIRATATEMTRDPQWQEDILEPPQVLGVDAFGENSVTIRLWIKTSPLRQWDVSREFRRRLKYAFDKVGISIPFPQRSIWFENHLEHRSWPHK
ncbi:mechanosensitive ion channel family protein [Lyngbya confervoides]|uniref:Mechanosensitive ion channel family protein n=1 Tax=Lyngbya confervoides BDU141951 TaxID=1574623 RepID=A0ABD4T973_9CYAN|nr:mechanosensitive ion channel family protein [Lyngbya confervoides]MCM1984867.1 mechanosensitive ion channel family protein [Lyngbya confervoides BDU141951]